MVNIYSDEIVNGENIYEIRIDDLGLEALYFVEKVYQRELAEEKQEKEQREKENKQIDDYNRFLEESRREQELSAKFQEYLEECLLIGDIKAYENASLDDF